MVAACKVQGSVCRPGYGECRAYWWPPGILWIRGEGFINAGVL